MEKSTNGKELENLNEITNKRYSTRLEKFGVDPKTLGWGCKEDQLTRFNVIIKEMNLKNKNILDIGCGFSDLYIFLKDKKIPIKSYTGIDINPQFIEINKKKFPENNYYLKDILTSSKLDEKIDVAIMLGLLNFKVSKVTSLSNMEYSKNFIKIAFSIPNECLVVDMLTKIVTPAYPVEDMVFYYSPSEMLDYILSLTPKIVLRHDYQPIPQREMMLFLKK